MLKRYVLAALMGAFNASYSMERELVKHEYLEDARQLQGEKGLYFSMLPKDVLGIVQYYRLHELLDQALRAKNYKETLTGIRKLAQLTEYAELFNDPRFSDDIIYRVSSKFAKAPKEAAQDINTLGAQLWLMHVRPGQIRLLEAAENGDVAEVQQLIDIGVNVNARSYTGCTALMCAALNGHVEVVKMLIDAGVNVNLQRDGGWTALIYAAEMARTEVVKKLIKAGANVNARNNLGNTVLIQAARNGYIELVKILIAAGADVTIRDKNGKTALVWLENRPLQR